MKTASIHFRNTLRNAAENATWDRLGMALSTLCAIHCLVTPFVLLSIPMLARYYLVHPLFHWLLTVLIVPVGVLSFLHGYKHHHRGSVFALGFPGLVIISIVPLFAHNLLRDMIPHYFEPAMMTVGSFLLISAHWINRKSCRDCEHGH